jgi:PAS domain-containing protein
MVDTRDQGLALETFAPSDMRERIESFDWAATPLGPRATWSLSLVFAVDMIVASRFPSALRWGPEMVLIYNDAYGPMLGERHPRVLGKTFAEAPPSSVADSEGPERAIIAGASGGAALEDLLLETVHPDGSVTTGYFNVRLSPLPDAAAPSGVGGVLIALTEVTRRVRAEQALRASEERYQLALRAASGVGTWDWDIVADKIYADPRYAVFHNVDPERAAAGAPLSEYNKALHPDDMARLIKSGRTHLKTTADFDEEYRLIQADGSVRWVQTRGRVERDAKGWAVRHRGVMVDITGRKRIEQALEAAEADLRIAVDAAGLGRWDHNPQTGERFWDKRCREIYGLPDGVIENPLDAFERLVHPDDLPALMDAVRAAMDAGRRQYDQPRIPHPARQRRRGALDRDLRPGLLPRRPVRALRRRGLRRHRAQGGRGRPGAARGDHGPGPGRRQCRHLGLRRPQAPTALVRAWLRHVRHGAGGGGGVWTTSTPPCIPTTARPRARPCWPRWTRPARRHRRRVPHDRPRRRQERWISAKGRGFFDDGGRPTRVVGATVDITERKRAELHLRLLVNELNHRVKNSLATIQAIAAQTFHAARSLPQAQEAFSARIVALAEAHDLLTRENWEGPTCWTCWPGWRSCMAAPSAS